MSTTTSEPPAPGEALPVVVTDEIFRRFFECAPVCLTLLAPDAHYLLVNPASQRLLGYSPEEEYAATALDRVHPDDRAALAATIGRLVSGQSPREEMEYRFQHKDGHTVWLHTVASALDGEHGGPRYVLGISQDVTDRRGAEEARRAAEALFRGIFDQSAVPITVTTPDGRYLLVNPATCALLGYTAAEMTSRGRHDVLDPADVSAYRESVRRLLSGEATSVETELRHVCKDGRILIARTTKSLIRDVDGHPQLIVGVSQDVTVQKRLEAERQALLAQTEGLLAAALEQADRDPLTGLLNHRAFHRQFHEEADRAARQGTKVCVALLDVDNFKFFNDAYGHLAGDDVLRQVADELRRCCRSYDTLARYAGDEFALLAPGVGSSEVLETRLSGCASRLTYRPPGAAGPIPLHLSYGLAVFPDDGAGRLDVLAAADTRLFRAKHGGSPERLRADELRLSLAQSLEGFSMLDALVTAVDTKDRYTRRHSEDVLTYSLQIARVLNLDEAMRHTLSVAALLHDVGKIGVPDHLLRKPGPLTAEEYETVKQHPLMGAAIVGAVDGFADTLEAVRHHHERWDGTGYPLGLAGAAVPLLARLMAVADAFSAMTTDRPYRKGMDPAQAREVLRAGAGSQWDPDCVQALLSTAAGGPAGGEAG